MREKNEEKKKFISQLKAKEKKTSNKTFKQLQWSKCNGEMEWNTLKDKRTMATHNNNRREKKINAKQKK